MNRINDIIRKWSGLCIRRGGGLLFIFVFLLSCNSSDVKRLNRRVTLLRKDKIPYGTYVAYKSLSYLFPKAELSVNTKGPSTLEKGYGKKAYIIVVPAMRPDPSEVTSLLNFVGEGNHVFISAFHFNDTLLHALNIRSELSHSGFNDSMRLSVYQPLSNDSLSFVYPGLSYDSHVSSLDSQYATILGRDDRGRPDLIKFSYKGGGSLFLHFAPTAFTNFFLLHKQNKAYYDNVMSYIPGTVNEVLWDEYFHYHNPGNSFSAFQYILGNPPLRAAFWLLLLLLMTIYLFESKRRQRMVPLIPALRNNSLDFVKTIGRLYYQRRDNQNLSVKMVTHFQDHIRTKYNLSAHLSDPEFVDRLSYKTAISKEFLQELTADLLRVQDSQSMTDAELLELNKKLEEFYKQA